MEEIVLVIIQVVFEVLIDALSWGVWDGAVTSQEQRRPSTSNNGIWAIVSIFAGALVGLLSLLVFPKPFISNSNVRVLNLILAPVAVWFLADYFSGRRTKKGIDTDEDLHKLTGVCFSVAFTLVRFVLISR